MIVLRMNIDILSQKDLAITLKQLVTMYLVGIQTPNKVEFANIRAFVIVTNLNYSLCFPKEGIKN